MDDVDHRVKEVIDLMLGGQWYPGKAIELAERYRCSVKTVQDWSRQAGRFLRMCRGNEEEFRERLLANLDFAGRLALTLKQLAGKLRRRAAAPMAATESEVDQ